MDSHSTRTIPFVEIRNGLDKLVFLLLARSAALNYNCCTHSGGIYQSQKKMYWVKRLASLGGSLCLRSSVDCTESVVPRFALAEFFVVFFVFEGGEELKKSFSFRSGFAVLVRSRANPRSDTVVAILVQKGANFMF